MSCPFYHWDHGYACMKTQKNVNDDIYNKYCRYDYYDYRDCPIYKNESSSSSSSSCFLTSACVEAKGLPDDCHELTVLRNFRDTFMKENEEYAPAICEYYHTAPSIVEKINAMPDRMQIYEDIYNDLVLPCVELIEKGENKDAYIKYRQYVLMLKERYLK